MGRIIKTIHMTQEHVEARKTLLEAEIALRNERERVAELRRHLPTNPVDDYLFMEGPADLAQDGPEQEVSLGSLVGDSSLVVYHFMFHPEHDAPCPMCTMWCDGFNAIVPHLNQNITFAIVAKAPIAKLRPFARNRGWDHLRHLSSIRTQFNQEFGMETDEGNQLPGVSVFTREDKELRHCYTASAIMGDGRQRGLDLLCPVWNILDLTGDGRGDWLPKLRYT